MVIRWIENFLRACEKKSFDSKMGFFEGYPHSFSTPFFHPKLFFHWLWESFLCVVWLHSNYLRDCLNIVLYAGKKSGAYDMSNRKREKVCIFTLKMGLRSYEAILQKKIHLRLKTFFRKFVENLLCIVWPYVICFKGAPNIVLYVNKTIGTVRHTNQKISTKPIEKTSF